MREYPQNRRDRIKRIDPLSNFDPLSEVFSLLNVRSARCTRFEASGRWSYRFPAKPALKFGAVLRGECWMDFGTGPRNRLTEGDTFLLANAPSYVLANDEGAFTENGIAMFDWEHSDVARHEGDDTVLVAGSFSFESTDAELLLDALPTFLLIPSEHPSATAMRTTLALLDIEIRNSNIGTSILTSRLADVLLVQVLRAAVDQKGDDQFGWVGALADARIGKAIGLMHGNAAQAWTVDELARAVAMSRSAFSRRFRSLVGFSPLDYLLRWRMRLARDMLRHGSTVAAAASRVGYSSESAFGNAFKRIYGQAPKRYWSSIPG